jgi:ActR/RegA family two-component response regulator
MTRCDFPVPRRKTLLGEKASDGGCRHGVLAQAVADESSQIDEGDSFARSLARSLSNMALRVHVARSFDEAGIAIKRSEPHYVVSELRVSGDSVFDFLPRVESAVSLDRFFVATVYPSVATAVRLIRMGVAGYVTKPVSHQAILEMFGRRALFADESEDQTMQWPTLDRTIWEYLCQVREASGSLALAARQLGLDRRSLRRMLAKYPPPL